MPTLELYLLMLLRKGDQTGYDLSKAMTDSHIWQASHQQVYRSLKKMDAQGLVAWELVPQEGKPDKKVYTLTKKGLTEMEQALAEIEPKVSSQHSIHTVMICAENRSYFHELALSLQAEISLVSAQIDLIDNADETTNAAESLALHRALYLYSAELKYCNDVLDSLAKTAA